MPYSTGSEMKTGKRGKENFDTGVRRGRRGVCVALNTECSQRPHPTHLDKRERKVEECSSKTSTSYHRTGSFAFSKNS